MTKRAKASHLEELTFMVSKVFSIPETARLMIGTLIEGQRPLSVKALVKRVRRSERSVRSALDLLLSKGILIRKAAVTSSKRLSYLYSIGPIDRLVKVLRAEILNQLERLERLEGRLGRLGRSTKRAQDLF